MNKHFAAFTLIRSQSIFVPFFRFFFSSFLSFICHAMHTHVQNTYIFWYMNGSEVVIYIAVSNVHITEYNRCIGNRILWTHWMNPHKENEIVNRCLLPLEKFYNTMQWTFVQTLYVKPYTHGLAFSFGAVRRSIHSYTVMMFLFYMSQRSLTFLNVLFLIKNIHKIVHYLRYAFKTGKT